LAKSIGVARARRLAACSSPAITPEDARAHVQTEDGHLVIGMACNADGTSRIVTVRARGRRRGPPTWTGRAVPDSALPDNEEADD
jgi:hypothetical protein